MASKEPILFYDEVSIYYIVMITEQCAQTDSMHKLICGQSDFFEVFRKFCSTVRMKQYLIYEKSPFHKNINYRDQEEIRKKFIIFKLGVIN